MVVGLILAAGLVVLGVGAAARQARTARRLRDDRFLPSDERAYLRGQVRRRLATSAVLVLLGGMIAGAFLSGMEDRATEIGNRRAAGGDDPPPEPDPAAAAEDARFVKFWGGFWIAVLVLVFVAVCLAVFDFWATRKYWMAQYRILKSEHEAKLRRDLAVYRQAKDNARMNRLGGGRRPGPDDTDENPPVN